MTQQERDRDEILAKVRDYYKNHHKKDDAFLPGSFLPYAGRVYDEAEMANLADATLEFWLTAGRYAALFEKGLAEYLGASFCYAVNSGSSANLLAFMALTSPSLGNRRILRGDEIITVACAFPTTVTPMLQYGAVPVFVDVEIPSYNIDVAQLAKALSPKTKAVMLAHTLGNPFDIAAVKAFCDKHGLWLIEDNCDALGSEYTLDGQKHKTGLFSDIGTSSFYPPHHMTTGEGGAVYTNDPALGKILLSMRDWGRDCICPSGHDNLCGHRFDRQFGSLPLGYDHKYVYSEFGYNLKMTDLQAAVGVAQLEKLPGFTAKRRANHAFLSGALRERGMDKHLILPVAQANSDPSWFGFLLTCRKPGMRDALVKALEGQKIQTRMLFSGNLLRHPCFAHLTPEADFRVIGDLPISDRILSDTFWVGVYPGMSEEKLTFMADVMAVAASAF